MDEVTKLTDRYLVPGNTPNDLGQNLETLQSFKLMIGGSDYHLFNAKNLSFDLNSSPPKRQ